MTIPSQKTERDLWVEMSIREISTQAHFAGIAFRNIGRKGLAHTDTVFSSIHSFLSHCAMVSKLLKGVDTLGRGVRTIGDVLGIPAKSPIHERTFRNHLEHYDERLRKWIQTYGTNVMVGTYNVGPKSAVKIPGMVFVSHFDPATSTFTFVNDDFDLDALFEESQKIKNAADQWVNDLQAGKRSSPLI